MNCVLITVHPMLGLDGHNELGIVPPAPAPVPAPFYPHIVGATLRWLFRPALAETVQSPSLPFVTAAATPPAIAEALRASLRALVGSPAARGLSIRGFEALTEVDYRLVIDHQDEAARLGYPDLV